ncbi:MAG TPA: peptidylprolyl isomerase [Polyangiaceae bacterium]|jgi:FKBP-type peptidyl-prolyl cis-trans isomerase SlyD|nr:peptidylprolyl isomerase [Polyangiaceae bacterium]
MKIQSNSVVAIDYTLKGDDGTVIDTSEGDEPLTYLHGHNNIVEGLEEALTGLGVGDSLDVIVPPEKGYGTHDEDLVFEVPREHLPDDVEPEAGMQLTMTSDDGEEVPVTITKVLAKSVEVDANHELAGSRLHFSVVVRSIRAATGEELAHGHVHAPGHHHH